MYTVHKLDATLFMFLQVICSTGDSCHTCAAIRNIIMLCGNIDNHFLLHINIFGGQNIIIISAGLKASPDNFA